MRIAAIALVSPDAPAACRAIRGAVVVASLPAVRRAVLAAAGPGPASLDLYGHSTRGHHHLRLDRQVVDALDHTVAAAFAALAADGVFARAGIVRLRLLGCETAVGPAAQASLTRLARITGVSVLGTTRRLFAAHHGPAGFRPRFEGMLVEFTPAVTWPRVRRILPAGWPSLPWGALAPSSAWRSSSAVPAMAT